MMIDELERTLVAPVRVFIVDDHHGYRSIATSVVEATEGFLLAGTAASAAEAVSAILAMGEPPDLVLMDINLGDGDGIETTRLILDRVDHPKVVFVSALAKAELPSEAASCGAAGYLPKERLGPASLVQVWAGSYDWRP